MAAVESIEGSDYINLEAKVGKGGLNGWSDVMAVQSLLKFTEESGRIFVPGEVPEPNGIPTSDLPDLILKYQKQANREVGMREHLKEDGVIGRARGKRSWGGRNVWTIVDMNDRCRILSLTRLGSGLTGDFIRDLQDRFPALRIAIGTPGITF